MIEFSIKIKTPTGTYDANNHIWIEQFVNSLEKPLQALIKEKELAHIAGIIQKDIVQRRILGGTSIHGSSYRPLKQSTIRKKGHSRPLYETGELSRSVFTKGNSERQEIYVGGSRRNIGMFLQYGTRRMRPLPFFGISDEAENEIDNYLELLANKYIKKVV